MLGLGIGANATIFTVVERVLLTPLPYRAPDELVMIWERNLPRKVEHNVVSPQNYLDWKDRARSFSDLAAFTWSQMTLTDGARAGARLRPHGDAEPLRGARRRAGARPHLHRRGGAAGRARTS